MQTSVITDTATKFDVICKVVGGGFTGKGYQHGIARALLKADEEYRPKLKRRLFNSWPKNEKERNMFEKARRAPQFSEIKKIWMGFISIFSKIYRIIFRNRVILTFFRLKSIETCDFILENVKYFSLFKLLRRMWSNDGTV